MFSKLVRLGRDAELATTPSGKQVLKIVAAYDVGWGDNKKTVWLDAALWGERGQKLAQYLQKGVQVVIHGDDVEPDAFQGRSGIQSKLKMNVINVELVARSNDAQKQSTKQQSQQSQHADLTGFDDESIPF